MARIDGRTYKDLRPVEIIPGVNKFAEGSCLIRCGNTHVLCTASVEERVPPHVPYGEGWVTAEYSMLPRANRERSRRDVSKGKLSPRSAEIQRLVGRALRASIDMRALGERTITIDCDVLQGDGGTRTASVTGGYVALALACQWLVKEGYLLRSPLRTAVAAVSAGIVDDELLLDLCYEEDSNAQVDLNCIMTEQGELVEIQGLYHPGAAPAGRPVRQGHRRAAGQAAGGPGPGREAGGGGQPMKVVLASHNKKKMVEMKTILSAMGVEVLSQADVGVDLEPEETGTTFAENAAIKAQAVMEATGLPAIADDSGLMVDALNGEPGVYSARYGGPGLDDTGRWQLLLKNMEGIENRACKFVSVICCCFPDGQQLSARGECPGILAHGPTGDGGFGYDPIFNLPELGKTMAQLTPEEKNKISHRAKALAGFQKEWEKQHGTDQ